MPKVCRLFFKDYKSCKKNIFLDRAELDQAEFISVQVGYSYSGAGSAYRITLVVVVSREVTLNIWQN
jgi:hypothetical protein